MAKENYVFITGQVCSKPKILLSKEGEPLKASLLIKTIRRHYVRPNLRVTNNGSLFDVVPVTTANQDCIKTCMGIQENDIVELKGVYTTKEVHKKYYCQSCGKLNVIEGVTTFVTPIYLCVTKRVKSSAYPDGYDVKESGQLLRNKAEISNTIKIIGTLCRNPEKIVNVKQASAQYQIASNRRFHIKEDDPSARTDYPWVKSFGPQAEVDFQVLHTGSVVYIDGCIQSRQIKRKPICEHCDSENTIDDVAYEIVPYSVEYLSNCNIPESEDSN